MVWNRYLTRDKDDPDSHFMDYVLAHINESRIPDAFSVSEDWTKLMNALGIHQSLQAAIMHPEYRDLRATASCKFWLQDSIKTSYLSLEVMDDNLVLPAPVSRKGYPASEGKGKAPEFISPSQPNPVIALSPEAPPSMYGHTMLWHSCHIEKANRFLNANGDGLDMSVMASAPGDFSGAMPVVFFTPQKETADRYARWTKHKTPLSEVVIVQVAVPDPSTPKAHVLLFLGKPVERRSGDLEEGNLALPQRSTDLKYTRTDSWTLIQQSDALDVVVDGAVRKAIQWFFRTKKGEKMFSKECKDKV